MPDPEIRVVWPTVTPATSVMALSGPGVPSKGTPRSRARGFPAGAPAVPAAGDMAAIEVDDKVIQEIMFSPPGWQES